MYVLRGVYRLATKLHSSSLTGMTTLTFFVVLYQTNIGNVLISVNPYKMLPIYTEGVLEDYIGKNRLELPPHIFSIGEAAYRAMKNDKENQCIIIRFVFIILRLSLYVAQEGKTRK